MVSGNSKQGMKQKKNSKQGEGRRVSEKKKYREKLALYSRKERL